MKSHDATRLPVRSAMMISSVSLPFTLRLDITDLTDLTHLTRE